MKVFNSLILLYFRKHLLNALPYVNTGPSLTLMKNIILKKSVPDSTVNDWVSSIAFISDPTAEMLEASSELLQKSNFNHHIVLGVSSIMHTYCAEHSTCLVENEAVYSSVLYLENKIQQSKQNLRERKNQDDVSI